MQHHSPAPRKQVNVEANDVKKNNEEKEKVYSVMAPCGATAAAVWTQSQNQEKRDGGFSERVHQNFRLKRAAFNHSVCLCL